MKKVALFLKKNLKWFIALWALILFIAIIRSVYKESITDFDDFYYKHISSLISNKMTFFVKTITNLGSAVPLILITIFILLIFKNKKYGILTMVNLIVVFLFNLFLKIVFARPRPMDINIIAESGFSFPSGHAMVSTAFYGFLIYMIWKTSIPKKRKIIYIGLLIILIVLICLSRIYLGVHYASDVFGGMCISISYLVLFTSIVSKYLLTNKNF